MRNYQRKTKPTTLSERFENLYMPVTESGCWLWLGSINRGGYGKLSINGKTVTAHRAVYEQHLGKIPVGLCLDHKCKVRCCVNPSHLEPVTLKENIRRGDTGKMAGSFNRMKTHCLNGHEFSLENTKHYMGRRLCLKCRPKKAPKVSQ